jgi:hypothetical protein
MQCKECFYYQIKKLCIEILKMGFLKSKTKTCKDMQKMNKIENPHLQKIKKFLCIKKKFKSKNIFSIA